MKSERRHDLETNELAVRVQNWLEHAKPYATQIMLVILGVFALVFIWSGWDSSSSQREQTAWDEYTLASYSSDPELNSMKLLAENEEYSGTPVPEWAFLAWCDRQVLLASQTYLVDRATTTSRLNQVLGIFETLAEEASNDQVRDRARFGRAQVLEMLGKVDESRAEYARVKGNLSALAADRAEQLETPEVKEACDWLATAELPKRATPSTSGAATGTRPNFEADVPAPMPNSNPLDDTRSFEEILGGPAGSANDENRYGEDASSSESETTESESTDREEPADSESSDAEEPASDTAEQ